MSSTGVFGPYELRGLLGRGGMGEVHRAYDREQARDVALKLLPPALAADVNFVERFRRESYAAARLNDPHVIPIHRFGEIDGRLYIDMRLVNGVDLAELIVRDGPLPLERAVALVGQAAEALDAAHADGLVHRDVKPSNLLVTAQDFVYLLDFGIAQAVGMGDAQRPLTADGTTIGTFDYMAPERILSGRAIDARADIYSLACVLYEALTGSRPFPVDGLPALMHAHLHTPPPRVTAVRPELPPALDDVIARGMAKDPGTRQATAGALAADARRAAAQGHAAATVIRGPGRATMRPEEPPTIVRPGRRVDTPAVPPPVPAGPGGRPPQTGGWPGPSSGWPSGQPVPPRRPRVGVWLAVATTAALVAVAVLLGIALRVGAFRGTTTGQTSAVLGSGVTTTSRSPAVTTEGSGGGSSPTVTDRQTVSAPQASVPEPTLERARGDLGLPTPISTPACDSRWVVFLGSATHPGSYASDVATLLAGHPGAQYLLTAGECTSLRQQLNGNLIYAVYVGPYPSQADACQVRNEIGGGSYVKVLDDNTPADHLWTC